VCLSEKQQIPILFGLTRPRLKPTIYTTQVQHTNHYNTASGWKYLDHLKFVFNNIGLDHLINNEINKNTFKRFFGSSLRKREFDCINKKCSLEFFKNVCIFHGKQLYLSNVVEFQCQG
jgi:hypothetical protein